MKVKRILDELKEYYYSIPYQGLETIDSGPPFSKLDHCAFFAVMKTLTKEELKEARHLMFQEDYPSDLFYIIDECLNPKPYNSYEKNEKIETLIKRFLDKKSKRVTESRKALQYRFDKQSFADQKKIIKAFLTSSAIADRDWAAVEADKRWDKSYTAPLANAYAKKQSRKLAITVIRHMPIEFVKDNEVSLVMYSRVEYCIRLSSDLERLKVKYDLSFFEYLYIAARSGVKVNKPHEDIEAEFFRCIFEFAVKSLVGANTAYCHVDNIPWLRRALWALGELRYNAVVLKFLQMKSYCVNAPFDNINRTQLYFAHEWIRERYYPDAEEIRRYPFDSIRMAVENYKHPRVIKIRTKEDLDLYDDLPPDTIRVLMDFL